MLSMWFDRSATTSAAGLTLEELAAVRPRYLRGEPAPGRRGPEGARAGRGRARSLDFDGIGPYAPGDDVRRIDWRATARSGSAQVKQFRAQSRRARIIVLDLHAGLWFGARTRLMAKTAALTAAHLAWEAHALSERTGLVLPGGEETGLQRDRRHMLRLLDRLRQAFETRREAPAGDLAGAVEAAGSRLGAGDEVCVVSDFAEPLAPFLERTAGLAEIRVMRAFVVEEAALRHPLPAGRYPSLGAGGGREVFVLDRRRAAAGPAAAEQARATRRRALWDKGWEVVDALDLLPERALP